MFDEINKNFLTKCVSLLLASLYYNISDLIKLLLMKVVSDLDTSWLITWNNMRILFILNDIKEEFLIDEKNVRLTQFIVL